MLSGLKWARSNMKSLANHETGNGVVADDYYFWSAPRRGAVVYWFNSTIARIYYAHGDTTLINF